MKNLNLITAHIKSLRILILEFLTLPLRIYYHTICKFSNNIEEKETEFKVLNWIKRCLDSLIVLSYTLGTVIFLLILTTVIDRGYPIWTEGSYAGSEINGYYDYEEYLEYSKEVYYTKREFYEEKERYEKARNRRHFDEEMFFALLAILYFLPLGLGLSKELLIRFLNIGSNNNT